MKIFNIYKWQGQISPASFTSGESVSGSPSAEYLLLNALQVLNGILKSLIQSVGVLLNSHEFYLLYSLKGCTKKSKGGYVSYSDLSEIYELDIGHATSWHLIN